MSSQTSSTDFITAMLSAQTYLYRFAGPVLMLVGTIGGIINLVVFTQKTLRKNPCSIYFIAYNLANFLYIYSSLLSLTLQLGYNIDPSAKYLSICRLRLYITTLLNCLSPYYLILASIDRILITSSNALTRRRSTLRLAYTCTLIGTVFCTLFHSSTLILVDIIQTGPSIFFCDFQQGIYLRIRRYYAIIKEILSLLSMLIFGLWSVKNIQSIRRVRPSPGLRVRRTDREGNFQLTSSKDRQLMLMLFLDTSIYVLFSFVFAIFLLYYQITPEYIKSAEQIQTEMFVGNVCLFIICIPFCTSCYTNLIASKTFRKQVKKVLS